MGAVGFAAPTSTVQGRGEPPHADCARARGRGRRRGRRRRRERAPRGRPRLWFRGRLPAARGACRRGRPAACGPLSSAIGRGTLRRPHRPRSAARRSSAARRPGPRGTGRRFGGRGHAARGRRSARARRAPRLRGAHRRRRRAQRGAARARVHGARDRRRRRRPVRRPGSTDRGRRRDPRRRPGRRPARQALALGATWRSPSTMCAAVTGARPRRCRLRLRRGRSPSGPRSSPCAGRAAAARPSSWASRPAGEQLELDPLDFTNREKTLTGTIYGSEDPAVALPRLLDLVRSGELELASLVGPSFPLERGRRVQDQPRR